ncbi:hypothetical protein CC117_16605 [Parafrankia colletiae]|uniref:Uncharacterized protein n=1 Tax=Parafrankia colletiae TaxID=573497 RepID=A0A1S1QWF5_9ACTN|nr:hypothetical protein CC117_16605 [Parafrankia colletiae]
MAGTDGHETRGDKNEGYDDPTWDDDLLSDNLAEATGLPLAGQTNNDDVNRVPESAMRLRTSMIRC